MHVAMDARSGRVKSVTTSSKRKRIFGAREDLRPEKTGERDLDSDCQCDVSGSGLQSSPCIGFLNCPIKIARSRFKPQESIVISIPKHVLVITIILVLAPFRHDFYEATVSTVAGISTFDALFAVAPLAFFTLVDVT